MKKVFLFLSAISFVAISSCSSNDDSPATPDQSTNVLVKRAVYHQADPEGFNFTVDYIYDGNKLVKEVYDDGTVANYFYTGNLITKIEYVIDGEIDERETMTYNADGKLATYKMRFLEENSDYVSSTYTYNNDNTITVASVMSGLNGSHTIMMLDGEMSTIIQQGNSTFKYTYDDKNSPFRNIIGFAEIAYATAGDFEMHGRGKNILSIINETYDQNYTLNTFTYNSANYPTMVKSTAIFDYDNPVPSDELTVVYSY